MGQSLPRRTVAMAALLCVVALAALAPPAGAAPVAAGDHAAAAVEGASLPSATAPVTAAAGDPAGTESAAAANVTATRTSLSTVTVNVSASQFSSNTSDSNATVTLTVGNRSETYSGRNVSGTFVYRVPVKDLSASGRDLKSASVRVDPVGENTSATDVTVDLQTISLGSASEVRLDASTLRVPVASSQGIADGAGVAVGVGADGAGPVRTWRTNLTADGSGWLTVSVGSFDRSTLLNGTLTLTPRIASIVADELRVNPRTAAVGATFDQVGDGLAVDHPLVFTDVRYTVAVRTADPQGQYVRTVSPAERGRIVLPDQLLVAENRTVTVAPAANETTLFTASHSSERPTRTVTGSTLSLDEILPPEFSTVWVDTGERIRKISDPNVTGGTLTLPTDLLGEGSTTLVLQGRTVQPVVVNVTDVPDGTSAQSGTDTAGGTNDSETTATSTSSTTPVGTASFRVNTTMNPSTSGSALMPPIFMLFLGLGLSLLVSFLFGGDDGAAVAGAVATFFAVFGPGLGLWLGGTGLEGMLVFLVAALVGVVVFAGTYLFVGFLLRTKSASYPVRVVALGVAALFSAAPAVAVGGTAARRGRTDRNGTTATASSSTAAGNATLPAAA